MLLEESGMHSVTQTHSQQLFAIVGSAYIAEHHADERHRYFSPSERPNFAADFDEMLKYLRAALSLR